jgi:hypothetical protein
MIFKSITIGPAGLAEEFIDGGLGTNNPIEQVLDQAHELFHPSERISCILSIGTGKLERARYKPGFVPSALIDTLVKVSTDCEAAHEGIERRFESFSDLYFRFNVEQGLQDVALDDWNRLGEVKTLTVNYLKKVGNQKKLEAVAEAIYTRRGQVALSQLRTY